MATRGMFDGLYRTDERSQGSQAPVCAAPVRRPYSCPRAATRASSAPKLAFGNTCRRLRCDGAL